MRRRGRFCHYLVGGLAQGPLNCESCTDNGCCDTQHRWAYLNFAHEVKRLRPIHRVCRIEEKLAQLGSATADDNHVRVVEGRRSGKSPTQRGSASVNCCSSHLIASLRTLADLTKPQSRASQFDEGALHARATCYRFNVSDSTA